MITLLMRFIKPINDIFNVSDGCLFSGITLNNKTWLLLRFIPYNSSIKSVINSKNLNTPLQIYNEYVDMYSYINEDF